MRPLRAVGYGRKSRSDMSASVDTGMAQYAWIDIDCHGASQNMEHGEL